MSRVCQRRRQRARWRRTANSAGAGSTISKGRATSLAARMPLMSAGGQTYGQITQVTRNKAGKVTGVVVQTANGLRHRLPPGAVALKNGQAVTRYTAAQVSRAQTLAAAAVTASRADVNALIGLARTVYAAGQPRSALRYAQHAESLATANRHGLMGREARAFLDQLASETSPHGPARSRAADSRMLQAPA